MTHVQWGPAMRISLSAWAVNSPRAEATPGFPTHGAGPSLGWAVSGRNPLRPLEKRGCAWTLGTLCLLSGPLVCFPLSPLSLPPATPLPQFSLATPTSILHDRSVKVLKSLKRELIGLSAGQREGAQGAGRPLVFMVQTSHGPPGMSQLSSAQPPPWGTCQQVWSPSHQERPARNSGFGWLQSQPPQSP